MAKKQLTIRDLLTKASYVFPSDMYLVFNQYLVSGKESDENTNGRYICRLTPEMMQLCNETFGNDKIIYFTNIKKAKDALEEYTEELSLDQMNEMKALVYAETGRFLNIDEWKDFQFTEEQVTDIFNGTTIDIFKDDPKIPETILNKSMLPLVTDKNIQNITYYLYSIPSEEYGDIYNLVISHVVEYFQIYMRYQYLSIQ